MGNILTAARITLTNGKMTLVDQDMFDELNQHRWGWLAAGGYVVRTIKKANGKKGTIFMHKVILPAPSGMVTDHINSDPLDNRRENLRIATQAQNVRNRRKPKHGTSPYKGVLLIQGKYWRAYCNHTHIGHYDTAEQAALAYDSFARKRFGEFAKLNFPNADPSAYPPTDCTLHRFRGGSSCERCGAPVHPGYKYRRRK